MLAQLRALGPATLQKVWLPSASLAVLQLRVPGRTTLALIDARLVLAALVDERPTSTDATPRSQATLRAALEGATLSAARFEVARGEEASDRNASLRLAFETEAGVRALVAEPRIGALLLLAPAGEGRERIVWAGSGGDPSRRPGSEYREVVPVEPGQAAASITTGGETADREVLRDAVAAEEAKGVSARRKELEKRLRAKAQKLRRTLAAIDEDKARAGPAAEDRRKGELLVAHAASVPRGAR